MYIWNYFPGTPVHRGMILWNPGLSFMGASTPLDVASMPGVWVMSLSAPLALPCP